MVSLAGIAAFLGQRWLLYPAPPVGGGELVLPPGVERVWLESPGVRAEAVLLPATAPPRDRPGPILLFAHGNGELIDFWMDAFGALRDAGASILLVEYPGYGRSSGTPSQASITRTMVAAYDWAIARPGVEAGRIVGYGRSLGGGAICALALERPLAAVVLESVFTSVREIAKTHFGVPGFLVRDPYDNIAALGAFRGPVLLLHGERDTIIREPRPPPARGRSRLGAAAASVRPQRLPTAVAHHRRLSRQARDAVSMAGGPRQKPQPRIRPACSPPMLMASWEKSPSLTLARECRTLNPRLKRSPSFQ